MQQVGIDNLTANGFNAFSFSIMGMLIVFGGLAVISIYITLLPRILSYFHKLSARREFRVKSTSGEVSSPRETELLLAVAVALHLEQTRSGGRNKITWPRHEGDGSAWQAAGRLRGLANRSHLPSGRT